MENIGALPTFKSHLYHNAFLYMHLNSLLGDRPDGSARDTLITFPYLFNYLPILEMPFSLFLKVNHYWESSGKWLLQFLVGSLSFNALIIRLVLVISRLLI